MLREITAVDFPASWRAGDAPRQGIPGGRSHDTRAYGKRFMLRLDEPTREKLESLSRHFKKSSAKIIRQLVAQATPEAFPTSWHLAVEEHRQQGDV
jgi:predicted DNA-binding protein